MVCKILFYIIYFFVSNYLNFLFETITLYILETVEDEQQSNNNAYGRYIKYYFELFLFVFFIHFNCFNS